MGTRRHVTDMSLEEDAFGENIPLTIGPKWRPAARKYGSILATPNFDL